jgi:hypothetical protein
MSAQPQWRWCKGEPVLSYDERLFAPPPLPSDDQRFSVAPAPAPAAAVPVISDEPPAQDSQVAWKLKNQIQQIDFLIETIEKSNRDAETLIARYNELLGWSGAQLDKAVDAVRGDWQLVAEALTDERDRNP